MKQLWRTAAIIFALNFCILGMAHAQKPVPPYAKWGRLAVEKTKQKYPKANVVDYLHIGREIKGADEVEKFKLWLKEGKKEFGVYVTIEFDPKTDQVKRIILMKTPR
ncbi:DUF3889 domain-containing protein [Falsibacillus pallidus]|uniref:Uncharacterized protein DUF3889 n=1 Tax=Falsibacillus pallidus TaxID=493781 RepID=A0A370GNT4_9BACI|nr:DUF3889 domain-containing protein [Falsibacillus pallidus]RDI45398.1 uncharacterized protein DUF3889 [Falsibacillus pallidus]